MALGCFCQSPGVSPTPEAGGDRRRAAAIYIEKANTCDIKNLKCRIAAYTKAIEIAPDFAEAYSGRAITYRTAGDAAHAMEDFSKVIEIDPQAAQAYLGRGALHDEDVLVSNEFFSQCLIEGIAYRQNCHIVVSTSTVKAKSKLLNQVLLDQA